MRKKVWILIAAVAWLGGCYLIGQYRYPDKEEQFVQIEQPQSENGNQSVWSEFNLEFEGSEKTSDNPWGYTAGIIETDFAGECILLNPNTLVTLNVSEDWELLNLAFKIHPWVAESSDGAGIVVQFLDSDENVLAENLVDIGNETKWKNHSFELKEKNVSTVKLACNNGKNNDDAADWVIVSIQ